MAEPIVFISRFGVKEGVLEDLRSLTTEVIASLRETKPRTVVYLAYLDEPGTEVSFLHAFPDAEAMDLHFEGVDERAAAAYRYLEPRGWEVYGRPSDGGLATLQQAAASAGVSLTVRPQLLGGFLRLADEPIPPSG